MARLKILTSKELQAIYGIPVFGPEDQELYFSLDPQERQSFDGLRNLTAKMYFILQLGYFKAKRQFFLFELHALTDDVAYIQRRYFPDGPSFSDMVISKPTRLTQQREILRLMDYQMCSQEWRKKLRQKAQEVTVVYSNPVYVFKELVAFLEYHRVVLPGYTYLQEFIGSAMTQEQSRIEKAVAAGIPAPKRSLLDNLLTAEENLYQLTLLKHEPKDFSHQEVQKEVERRRVLSKLYPLACRFLPTLGISNENIKYYSSLVNYYTVQKLHQLSRDTRHAYLLCFILFRYQMVNDNLMNTFIYHVHRFIETAQKQAKEKMAEERLEANKNLKKAGMVLNLFTDETIPDDTLFRSVKSRAFSILSKDQFALVSNYLVKAVQDETAFEWQQYVKLSARFKLNLRHLFVALSFESRRQNDPLLAGATFLKENFSRGKSLGECPQKTIPQACIPDKLKKYLHEFKEVTWYGKTKKRRVLNVDKYEFLIYKLLKKEIDAGNIFIRDSRNFRSFEDDIISDELWQRKDVLIKNLDIPFLQDPIAQTLDDLETELEALIQRVNQRIVAGENKDIKITGSGENQHWHLPYHNDQEPVDHPIFSHLPKLGIVDVLLFVHQQTGCLSSFSHLLSRFGKVEPQIPLLIGCMLAFGENIGIRQMAEMSDLSLQELLTTAHDFVRLETLKPANDLVTNAAARLPIFKFYNIEEEIIHGSVDGQKFETQIETINSRHSPKYFVLGKGVSSITLVANHLAPNAKIIGTHEHESHFLYDILYNNTSEIDPRIVSTDTHGTNQVNHALLDIFGYQFAPRYKNLDSEHRSIVGFRRPRSYKDLVIKPTHKVNRQLIIDEEDNLKRIIVSLALKSTTQSTIVRKLASYERQNRTKKALWEYNNIIESIYILNYIDSLLIRQCVQKALNRGEAYHRLKRNVFHDNEGKFRVRTELEQNIWNECARFITNNIIYCNAYIQSALYEAAVKAGRLEEAEIIKRISPVAWQNINLRGRFEFQKQYMFNIDELINIFTRGTGWQELKKIDETG